MKTNHKKIVTAFMLITILATLIHLSGCGGGSSDPTPTPITKQEEVSAKLTSATWKMQTVTVDGIDKTSVYQDLSLKFSATSFTSANGGAVWPASGTWTFTTADATAIKRDDGLEVTLQEVTDTSLKLALTWSKTTLGPGRIESVSGQNVFSFGL
ncbi:MAG: hypothetical protein AABY93_01855 [Bacteroidota bacterium]